MTTQPQEQTAQTEHVPQLGDRDFKAAAHADDAELAEAEAALSANPDGEPEAESPPPEPTPEPEARPEVTGKPKMVPIERLNDVIGERNSLREEMAELRGMVSALASGKAPAQASAPEPAETPEQRIAALDESVSDLAAKYEAGELSTKDYEVAKFSIQRQMFRLENEALQRSAQPAPANDTYLQEQTDALAVTFPVINDLSAADIEAITPLALRNAAREKIDIGTDLKFRRYVAETAQRVFGTAATAQPAAKAASQNAAAAGLAKIELASRAPPNLNQHGVANGGTSASAVPTQEQMLSMSDDQLAALPPAVLAKLTGASR